MSAVYTSCRSQGNKLTEPVPPPKMPIVELLFTGAGSTSFRLLPLVSTLLFFFFAFSSSCNG